MELACQREERIAGQNAAVVKGARKEINRE
jgi:hypothetical protein